MSLVTITRLKPADLYEVQQQTANDALISAVIAALQADKQNAGGGTLNTNCPTCLVAGQSKGFLPVDLPNGNTANVVCTTCHGYLRIHTVGGALTPPVNVFGSPLVVTRLLPADLLQANNGFMGNTKLDQLVTSLQNNFDIPLTNNCPLCDHTGWQTVQLVKTMCTLCNGEQKTAIPYTLVDGVPVVVPPTIPPPDPITPPTPVIT